MADARRAHPLSLRSRERSSRDTSATSDHPSFTRRPARASSSSRGTSRPGVALTTHRQGRRHRSDGAEHASTSAGRSCTSCRATGTPTATCRSSSTIRASCSAAICSGTRCSRTSSTRCRRSSTRSVRALKRSKDTLYVPGHGRSAIRPIRSLRRDARRSRAAPRRRRIAAGTSAADAGAAFTLPPSLGDWALFNKVFYQRAFEAWYKELKA